MRPQSNGLVEITGEKQPKESGFFCLQLITFLTDEINHGGDNSWEYWHNRHIEASEGNCFYKDRCPIYKRTIEKQKKHSDMKKHWAK